MPTLKLSLIDATWQAARYGQQCRWALSNQLYNYHAIRWAYYAFLSQFDLEDQKKIRSAFEFTYKSDFLY